MTNEVNIGSARKKRLRHLTMAFSALVLVIAMAVGGVVILLGRGDVLSANSNSFQMVSASGPFQLGLMQDGTIIRWGNHHSGTANLDLPVRMTFPGGDVRFNYLNGTWAISTDGRLWGIGTTSQGQNGTQGSIANPVHVGGVLRFSRVQSGLTHTAALATDGRLFVWGRVAGGPQTNTNNPQNVGVQEFDAPTHIFPGVTFRGFSVGGHSHFGNFNPMSVTAMIGSDGTLWTMTNGWHLSGTGHAFGSDHVSAGTTDVRTCTATGLISQRVATRDNEMGALNQSIRFNSVSIGDAHAVAVAADGRLFAWGLMNSGALGDGWGDNAINNTNTSTVGVNGPTGIPGVIGLNYGQGVINAASLRFWRTVAVHVGGGLRFSQVSAGGHHTLAISTQGRVYSWGAAGILNASAGTTPGLAGVGVNRGQVGRGTPAMQSQVNPNPIPNLESQNIISISAGARHSLVVASDGTGFAFGDNSNGQLGDRTRTTWAGGGATGVVNVNNQRTTPVVIIVTQDDTAINNEMMQNRISAGRNHVLYIDEDGILYAWGSNSHGQIGNGTLTDALSPTRVIFPEEAGDVRISYVNAGQYNSAALDTRGNAWWWGANNNRQINSPDPFVMTPVNSSISNDAGEGVVVQVSISETHSMMISHTGFMSMRGAGRYINGVDGADGLAGFFQQVPEGFGYISTGRGYTLGIANDNRVFSWGRGALHMGTGLPHSNWNTFSAPAAVTTGSRFAKVIAGSSAWQTSLGLSTAGNVYWWGANPAGGDASTPTRMHIQGNPRIVYMALGSSSEFRISQDAHALLLAEDGRLFAWGNQSHGQIGDGIVLGSNSVLARNAPIHVGDNLRFAHIDAGGNFSIAIATNGEIYAWGDNEQGQFGNGARIDSAKIVRQSVNPIVDMAEVHMERIIGFTSMGGDSNTRAPSVLSIDSEGRLFRQGGTHGIGDALSQRFGNHIMQNNRFTHHSRALHSIDVLLEADGRLFMPDLVTFGGQVFFNTHATINNLVPFNTNIRFR